MVIFRRVTAAQFADLKANNRLKVGKAYWIKDGNPDYVYIHKLDVDGDPATPNINPAGGNIELDGSTTNVWKLDVSTGNNGTTQNISLINPPKDGWLIIYHGQTTVQINLTGKYSTNFAFCQSGKAGITLCKFVKHKNPDDITQDLIYWDSVVFDRENLAAGAGVSDSWNWKNKAQYKKILNDLLGNPVSGGIGNQTTLQTNANFNIDGQGIAASLLAFNPQIGTKTIIAQDAASGYLGTYTNHDLSFVTNWVVGMMLLKTGQLKLNAYSAGAFDAAQTKTLGIDANGNVVTAAPVVGSSSVIVTQNYINFPAADANIDYYCPIYGIWTKQTADAAYAYGRYIGKAGTIKKFWVNASKVFDASGAFKLYVDGVLIATVTPTQDTGAVNPGGIWFSGALNAAVTASSLVEVRRKKTYGGINDYCINWGIELV